MQLIKIVGIGFGGYKQLSIEAWEVINEKLPLYTRTSNHPLIKSLIDKGFKIKTFDDIYNKAADHNELIDSIVDCLKEAANNSPIVYLVPGSPTMGDMVTKRLSKLNNISIISGGGIGEQILAKANFFSEDYRRISCAEINVNNLSLNYDLIIDQIEDNFNLNELKLKLLELYPENHSVYISNDLEKEDILKKELYELDRDIIVNPYTVILIPAIKGLDKERHDFTDLLEIIKILRAPKGCPWDAEQTHMSILNNLTEETYELIAAFKNDDRDEIIEELGDLMMQIIFHAQIATEIGDYNIYDIISKIVNKLYFRHPHVFGEINVDNSQEVLYNWDILKKIEKNETTVSDSMNKTKGLPALIRSQKISTKARKLGFDWESVDGVLDKISEELIEVKTAISKDANIAEEIGDLFFSTVSLCSFLNLDAEEILQTACEKFIKRFSKMESISKEQNINLEDLTYELWDKLWNEAKL
ncbi:MAG: nucleoside triphosphate pyrophosphohydrolase [Tissierellia bacterium]|nr:nucleoside triphosphate pyrophosphohydrolase [Tissierellia bacterium]